MFDRAELKAVAKSQIRGNIGIIFVCALLAGLIIGISSVVAWLTAPAFLISFIMIFLNLSNGVRPEISHIFGGFSLMFKALWLNILMGFFVFLWSMLLVVPGIMKSFAYMMAPYILAENPNMTAREALNESKRITQGHKMDLFVLELSFIGWGLLCVITAGIAAIYVIPYMQATLANAYKALKASSFSA